MNIRERNYQWQLRRAHAYTRRPRWTANVLLVLAVLAGLAAIRVVHNESVRRNNPPVACQLAGGTWDIWNGWRCG